MGIRISLNLHITAEESSIRANGFETVPVDSERGDLNSCGRSWEETLTKNCETSANTGQEVLQCTCAYPGV